METEKAPNLQGTVEKEKQSWGHHNAGFRAVLQSCDHKDSIENYEVNDRAGSQSYGEEHEGGTGTHAILCGAVASCWAFHLCSTTSSIQIQHSESTGTKTDP